MVIKQSGQCYAKQHEKCELAGCECACHKPKDIVEGFKALANEIQIGGDHYKEKAAILCPHCGEKLEHWDLSWAAGWDMFQYCITKYVFRWKFKAGLNDLRKAQHYLQKYIEVVEKEQRSSPEG